MFENVDRRTDGRRSDWYTIYMCILNITLKECPHLDLIYNSKVSNNFYRFNDSFIYMNCHC